MPNWSTMTWPTPLSDYQSEFPLSQEEENARLAEVARREESDEYGELWKEHARTGGDRPTQAPPNP